ncbi:hypothetical protein MOV75_40090, partial [Bradyrhizobium sp. PRIMUS42]|nr:hypothetical protein [Bradyrhizobium sp. PRIMUS42]
MRMRASKADKGKPSSIVRPAGSNRLVLPPAPRETENPASIAEMLTGLRAVASTRMAEAPALDEAMRARRFRSEFRRHFLRRRVPQPARNHRRRSSLPPQDAKEDSMKKTLAVLATVAAVGVTAVAAPAPAEARG